MDKLSELNNADKEQAILLLEPLIERAPEIAKRVASRRPFESPDDLRQAIKIELLELNETELINLFRAHPELAPENPLAMTSPSQSEQERLNLTSGENEHRARLAELNASYRDKFGFPFITALVCHQNMDTVLSEFEARLTSNRGTEVEQAIEQIVIVSSSRVGAAFGGEDEITS
ncbi:MAG: 2-oxo-4-hydroxy-4-carboxy-5-ureidoimidazoline decarboxylase [Rhizobiales bacterium]|nr:2-oxo-4-hydroxy-4-carboxy-5-ureidoimidazoline decarboxylase [Hyphomicrobiales bacterium]